jgi:hypothetical protein
MAIITELAGRARGILEGFLLSDGLLTLPEGSNANAYFSVSLVNGRGKHKLSTEDILSFLNVYKDIFIINGIDASDINTKVYDSISHGKAYRFCRLRISSLKVLTREYSVWYPEGVKEVPDDIELTPEKIAIWFMCDGLEHMVIQFWSTFQLILLV